MNSRKLIATKKRGNGQELTSYSKSVQSEYEEFWNINGSVPSRYKYQLTVAHNPRFIWYRNAKVGTRSILNLLRELPIELTAEQAGGCRYAPELYKDYLKFAFVRNPWDRFVSGWLNKIVNRNAFDFSDQERVRLMKFDQFVEFWSQKDVESCNIHFRLQSRLIDLNEVDIIGRMESFNEDVRKVFKELGLPLNNIPHGNKTNTRSHYSSYYSEKSKELVSEMYHKDILLFGYRFNEQPE
ncbi:MAG: sulfotransferase family 2 domain-containing protein [Cyclobacteriaceae bacterium]